MRSGKGGMFVHVDAAADADGPASPKHTPVMQDIGFVKDRTYQVECSLRRTQHKGQLDAET